MYIEQIQNINNLNTLKLYLILRKSLSENNYCFCGLPLCNLVV